LGVPALEDKLVQRATVDVLSYLREEDIVRFEDHYGRTGK
jgi:hypothetical protein